MALFSNTALITLAVEIVTFGNYYGVGGMIATESMVFLRKKNIFLKYYIHFIIILKKVFVFNAIVPPLAWAVDPWHLNKNRKRKIELEKGDKSLLT